MFKSNTFLLPFFVLVFEKATISYLPVPTYQIERSLIFLIYLINYVTKGTCYEHATQSTVKI
jgi:hypothetical protein